jgi:hypothetical protein
MANEIIVISEDRLRQIIKDVIPNGEKLSPEDRYVTTDQLSKIMKVSVQQICNMKTLGMGDYAAFGENLWDWVLALKWRKEIYGKITGANRKNAKKDKTKN